MQKIIFNLVATIFLIYGSAYADSNKIVKWIDSNGVTHYGDKLPPQEAGRNNAEMNAQGMVLKRNNVTDKKSDVSDQQKLDQQRKDNILLASYTKDEEIDLARDRNMQMDQAALQALTQQKANIASRTARNNETAQSFRARNKPIPTYLSEEFKQSQAESARIEKQIAQRNLNMEATRKRYAEDKEKFIALKQPTNVNSGTGSLEATLTAAPTAAGSTSPNRPTKK
jgi:uncharacterized protein YlaI